MTSKSEQIIDFIATGFYSGRSKYMPGTCGSIVAFFLACCFSFFAINKLIVSILVILIGVLICVLADRNSLYGNTKDPQQIVIDEFAGYFITIVFFEWNLFNLFIALVFFRFFDITKPTPIKSFESIPGGYGIIIDDLIAGLYAAIFLFILNYLIA